MTCRWFMISYSLLYSNAIILSHLAERPPDEQLQTRGKSAATHGWVNHCKRKNPARAEARMEGREGREGP